MHINLYGLTICKRNTPTTNSSGRISFRHGSGNDNSLSESASINEFFHKNQISCESIKQFLEQTAIKPSQKKIQSLRSVNEDIFLRMKRRIGRLATVPTLDRRQALTNSVCNKTNITEDIFKLKPTILYVNEEFQRFYIKFFQKVFQKDNSVFAPLTRILSPLLLSKDDLNSIVMLVEYLLDHSILSRIVDEIEKVEINSKFNQIKSDICAQLRILIVDLTLDSNDCSQLLERLNNQLNIGISRMNQLIIMSAKLDQLESKIQYTEIQLSSMDFNIKLNELGNSFADLDKKFDLILKRIESISDLIMKYNKLKCSVESLESTLISTELNECLNYFKCIDLFPKEEIKGSIDDHSTIDLVSKLQDFMGLISIRIDRAKAIKIELNRYETLISQNKQLSEFYKSKVCIWKELLSTNLLESNGQKLSAIKIKMDNLEISLDLIYKIEKFLKSNV